MYVDPGDLNKRIQIYRITDGETYDRRGKPVRERTLIRSCWAKVSSTSGTELIKAGQELTDAKKRFLIRWTSTEVTEAMVVSYDGEDHDIVRVNGYGDNKDYLEIWTDHKKAVT